MSRYIGNYVRVPSSEPQQASAPGIWSLSDQLAYQRANLWPPARDPYYNQTVLHLSGDVAGTRETNPVTQPRTFLSDASTNNFLLTPNGDVSARPFNPYLSNYSNYFSGSVDGLTLAYNAAFLLDTNFTLEGWIFPITSANQCIIGMLDSGGVANWDLYVLAANTVRIRWLNTSATIYSVTSTAIALNQWTHVAVTLSGTTLALYVSGVLAGTTTVTGSARNTSRPIGIGRPGEYAGEYFAGYLSNIRYVRGSVVYTGAFTPPTTPLIAISNTALLTCQSNRFKDNSTNNFTITVTGSPRVTDNSPFVEYATTSGSGYFDGNADYLSLPSNFNGMNFGTGAFSFECWIYPTALVSNARLIGPSSWASDARVYVQYYNNTGIGISTGAAWILWTSTTPTLNQWTHLVIARNAAGSLAIFFNGVRQVTPITYTSSIGLDMGYFVGENNYTGYLSGMRIIKGDTPYDPTQTTIIIPTAPITAIANTSLLTLQTRAPANNQGILDTSPNNFVITRTGNVAQGSFSPFSASGYSVSTTATNTLDLPGSVLAFGSSSFTVEAWVYATHTSGAPIVYPYNSGNAVTSGGFSVSFGTGGVGYYAVNGATPINYSATIPLNTWYHLALVKDGSAARLYLNGQLVATGTDSTTYTTPTGGARVGGIYNLTQTYGLVVNNLRIVTGQALYNANFTPATTNLTASVIGHQGLENTAITGTVRILTARDPYRIDRSSNNHTIGSSGSPQFLAISPFAPTQAYVASQIGGSGYFDGSSDYLSFAVNQAPLALGNSDFTVEAWVYRLNTNTAVVLAGQSDLATGAGSAYVFYVSSSSTSDLYSASGYSVTSPNPAINQWAHVAWVRTGGTYSSYLNGVRVGNRTDLSTATVNTGSTTYAPSVGGFTNSTSILTGYISGLRLIKGSGGYNANDTNIVIPTAPPVATQNTSLLLNFTGAGIVDSTGRNNLETVANSAVQTSVIKYGTGSLCFDGTGDYLFEPHSTLYEFGSGDFTIEFWARANSLSGAYTGVVGVWFAGNTVTANSWYVSLNGYNATNKFGFSYTQSSTSYELIFNATTSTGSWDHYAIVRSGGTLYGFKNGFSQTLSSGSSTISGAINNGTSGLYVGTTGTDGGGTAFNGYISNLRITKYARYTTNFNTNLPPGPFPLA